MRVAAAIAGLGIAVAVVGATSAAPKFEDTIAQRMQACTGCHGREGRAASDGYYPRIAGKPAGYLHNQLLNFRDGRRHYALMTALLDPLSDAYLQEIAGYFAALELPYPPSQPASVSADVLKRGRDLAIHGDRLRQIPACVACHGQALTGVAPSIPGLLGLPRDYINAQFGAWRTGSRRAHTPDCMAQIAQRLEPEDIGALSQWLASQPVPTRSAPATTLPAALPIPCGGIGDGAGATKARR